jgi:hypothetical protein
MKNKPIVLPPDSLAIKRRLRISPSQDSADFPHHKRFSNGSQIGSNTTVGVRPRLVDFTQVSACKYVLAAHIASQFFLISGPTALHISPMVEGHREDIGSNHIASLMRNKS